MKRFVLAADIGGTHITTAIVDLHEKKIFHETWYRATVNSGGSAEEILQSWVEAMKESQNRFTSPVEMIKMALPGPMDYKNGICLIQDQDKFQSMFAVQLKKELSQRLYFPQDQIEMFNDAACFLKGELFGGTLEHHRRVIGLTLGTGLGSAAICKGKARDAELWKMPFNGGIAEDYLSTRWFIGRFEELSNVRIRGVKDLTDYHMLSPYFSLIFSEFSFNLAKFICKFIKKAVPSAAVIGGNIALSSPYFLSQTHDYLKEMLGYGFPVYIASQGEKATLLGAGAS